MKQTIREYQSAQDYWSHVSKPCPPTVYGSSDEGTEQFTKTKSYADALELARHGWKAGLKQIAPMVAHFEDALFPSIEEPAPVYDVVGETPDVGAFLSGEPEHMIRFSDEDGKKRIIKIVYNMAASYNVSTQVIMRRGAVACALADCIERCAGIRAELVAVDSTKYQDAMANFITVKRAEEPLCLDRLAFVFAHPSMLRRLFFRSVELEPNALRLGAGGSYGQVDDVPVERRGDIYFPAMSGGDYRWDSETSAVKEALSLLEDAGIMVKPKD